MKVIVNKKTVHERDLRDSIADVLTSLDASQREVERLVQENKDLRVSEAHVKDENTALKLRLANVGADRDNFEASYKQTVNSWLDAIKEARKAEEETAAINIELMDREERIRILEQRIKFLEHENEDLRRAADSVNQANHELVIEVEDLTRIKNEYAEMIDELRKKVNSQPKYNSLWDLLVQTGVIDTQALKNLPTNRPIVKSEKPTSDGYFDF